MDVELAKLSEIEVVFHGDDPALPLKIYFFCGEKKKIAMLHLVDKGVKLYEDEHGHHYEGLPPWLQVFIAGLQVQDRSVDVTTA